MASAVTGVVMACSSAAPSASSAGSRSSSAGPRYTKPVYSCTRFAPAAEPRAHVRGAHEAADTDDGKFRAQLAAQHAAVPPARLSASGAPLTPPPRRARQFASRSRAICVLVLVAMTPSSAMAAQRCGTVACSSSALEIRRNLDQQGHALAVTRARGARRSCCSGSTMPASASRGLQIAQALRIRRGHVDGEVVRHGIQRAQAGKVVVRRRAPAACRRSCRC